MDMMQPVGASYKVQRRVAGLNDIRMDGMTDILLRARGKTVFDIGCNRGMVSKQFSDHYASLVHGCDTYEKGIETAREVFADIRSTESRFEVVDLAKGSGQLKQFGMSGYDIVVCLATYHKLKRIMPAKDLSNLFMFFGDWTKKYFAWRGTSDKPDENEEEIRQLDKDLGEAGLRRIHLSYLSSDLGVCAIWGR